LHQKSQPLGVFLFAGPSGVGKTETALELARQLFGGEQFVTTINMSEYQERHTISRLIGSPPGYVGFGEGGILTEAIRKKPYSVVLLDEVEKADVNVLNLFYQAFDKGVLADGEGREIDCKNIVFFLTSNLGSEQIEQWLNVPEGEKQPSPQQVVNSLKPVFAEHFKPALLARMTPIAFMPLADEIMGQIVERKLADLADTLAENQRITLTVKDKAINFIKEKCLKTANGARLIDQVIQRQIIPPVSLEILEVGLKDDKIIGVVIDVMKDGALSFAFKMAEDLSAEDNNESKQKINKKPVKKSPRKKTGVK
jgi:type VI secretion system protein VasG